MHWGGWGGRFSQRRYSSSNNHDSQYVFVGHPDINASEQAQAKDKEFSMYIADTEVETWTDPVHNDTFSDHFVPVYRFRRAMFNDFRGRMDWCLNEFKNADHNPVAAVNGDKTDTVITMKVKPGVTLDFDASATTDPDDDELIFKWWIYKKAGTYDGNVNITSPDNKLTKVEVPADADGKEIHVILEVADKGKDNNGAEISMYDYRRVVLTCSKK
jgi:hypothetical protein